LQHFDSGIAGIINANHEFGFCALLDWRLMWLWH